MAELFNARLHGTIQPLRAACYGTNYRNWEKTSPRAVLGSQEQDVRDEVAANAKQRLGLRQGGGGHVAGQLYIRANQGPLRRVSGLSCLAPCVATHALPRVL